jgi:IS4 transposase
VAADTSRKLPRPPVRLIAVRKFEAAGYVMLLSCANTGELPDTEAQEFYRFRWQVELAFKRIKSRLELGELPAKDPALARTIRYAKLLAALLLDDFTERFLAISPWGYAPRPVPGSVVADPTRSQ